MSAAELDAFTGAVAHVYATHFDIAMRLQQAQHDGLPVDYAAAWRDLAQAVHRLRLTTVTRNPSP